MRFTVCAISTIILAWGFQTAHAAGDTAVKKGDILILIGTDEAIENLPAN